MVTFSNEATRTERLIVADQPQFKHTVAFFARRYEDGEDVYEASGTYEAFHWASQEVSQRQQPGQPLVRIMDGQTSLWDTADDCLEVESDADILDIIHVAGYVHRAAKVFCTTEADREAFCVLPVRLQNLGTGEESARPRDLTA